MHSVQKMLEEGENMTGNILITGAKMVLPTGTVTGDLRITDGVISKFVCPTQQSKLVIIERSLISIWLSKLQYRVKDHHLLFFATVRPQTYLLRSASDSRRTVSNGRTRRKQILRLVN